LQFKKFHSISNNAHNVSIYILLQLFYWYRDIYNNRDISNDDYRKQKFQYRPSLVITRSHLQLINTSNDTFFSKLYAFLAEERRPVMGKMKLNGAMD